MGSKQFGLSRNSHIAMAFDDTKVKNRLTIELEVRTEAESGLLFYMARINHADFATVQLRDGLPYFRYDLGSGDTSTMIPTKINDGQWHKIKIMRSKQEGILYVDDASNRTTSPKKADILDVVGMLYVGGLPVNYTTRRIGPVTYSIDGCIRNLHMEEAPVDMERPTSSFRVGTCFVSAQRGTYFDGTGFAKAVGGFKVGLDLLIELEFRTTRTTGVLLGISSQKMDGLGIELVDEKLMFHVDNGAGRSLLSTTLESRGTCVMDNGIKSLPTRSNTAWSSRSMGTRWRPRAPIPHLHQRIPMTLCLLGASQMTSSSLA